MNEQPSMYIKQSLNSEVDKWLAEGNSITYVCPNKNHQPSGFNNRIKAAKNKDKRDVKTRARRPEQQAVWSDIVKLKNWLEAKSGRMKALGEMVGLSPDYLSQIKNSKRKCS